MSSVSRYLDPNLIQRLSQLQLSARSVVQGGTVGAHRSPVKGASIEFRQHRFYVPGDEPRRLDWRVLGRTDRPYIKEYEEETNLRCMVLLDCSGSMAYGRRWGAKFEYAARLAAALSYLMLGRTESVGLALFRQRLDRWLAPCAGTRQLSRVIDLLERAAPRGPSSPGAALHGAATRLERRGLVILLSDLFAPADQIRDGLAHLKHDRHEAILLQVLDPDEVEFPFRHWSRFRGLEGEGARMVEPAVVRRQYLEHFRRHQEHLKHACQSLRAEFHPFVTDRPLIDALGEFLQRREVVRGSC